MFFLSRAWISLLSQGRAFLKVTCCWTAFSAATVQSAHAGFFYTKVADSSSLPPNDVALARVGLDPQLNNSRQVALSFRGTQQNQQPSSSIYRWENGAYTKVISSGDSILGRPAIFNASRPVISDSGTVAFRASFGNLVSNRGFAKWNSNLFSFIGSDSASFPSMAINRQDRFFADVTEFGDNRIRSWDANGVATDHSVAPLEIPFEPGVDANDNNQISFRNVYPTSNTSILGVYVITDSGLKTIASSADGFIDFTGRPAINNAGQVAFAAVDGVDVFGPSSVYRGGVNQPLELIANKSDFDRIVSTSVALNDSGNVFFTALKNGSTALYSGGNPLTDRIIGTGDLFDGGRITTLIFGNGMLNDHGDFVFYAAIDDNSDGIADRDTVFLGFAAAVPEPSSVLLLVGSGITYCGFRSRRFR